MRIFFLVLNIIIRLALPEIIIGNNVLKFRNARRLVYAQIPLEHLAQMLLLSNRVTFILDDNREFDFYIDVFPKHVRDVVKQDLEIISKIL